MKYQVTITEILSRTERVEASSALRAEELVRKRYEEEDIVLDYNDFIEVNFEVNKSASSLDEEYPIL